MFNSNRIVVEFMTLLLLLLLKIMCNYEFELNAGFIIRDSITGMSVGERCIALFAHHWQSPLHFELISHSVTRNSFHCHISAGM